MRTYAWRSTCILHFTLNILDHRHRVTGAALLALLWMATPAARFAHFVSLAALALLLLLCSAAPAAATASNRRRLLAPEGGGTAPGPSSQPQGGSAAGAASPRQAASPANGSSNAAVLLAFKQTFSNGGTVLQSWASAQQDPCQDGWLGVGCSSGLVTHMCVCGGVQTVLHSLQKRKRGPELFGRSLVKNRLLHGPHSSLAWRHSLIPPRAPSSAQCTPAHPRSTHPPAPSVSALQSARGAGPAGEHPPQRLAPQPQQHLPPAVPPNPGPDE